MLWVLALLPVNRPGVGELVKVDQEAAVVLVAEILRDNGQELVARRLRPRPPGVRGASFNPNTCGNCGARADWHDLDGVVETAIYEGFRDIARGRADVHQWREAVRDQHVVICWLPPAGA